MKSSEQVIHGQKQELSDFNGDLIQTPLLVEQDFGSLEGKSWANQTYRKASRTDQGHTSYLNNENTRATYIPKESKQSLRCRAGSFLDLHLFPTLRAASNSDKSVIMVMSHGIILKYILLQFASQLPDKSIFLGNSEGNNAIDMKSLNDLCYWANTSYVELRFERSTSISCEHYNTSGDNGSEESINNKHDLTSHESGAFIVKGYKDKLIDFKNNRPGLEVKINNRSMRDTPISRGSDFPDSWVTLVEAVNGTKHLTSLKRTGGGIGRARFDKRQKTLKSFVKY